MSVVPWQVHQRFGQYVLVRPIAVGGMAEVWQARLDGPHGFERKFAIKRMTSTLADQPKFVQMFLDEARLMASLTHPNICQVYELGQRDESFYVCMEYIGGQTLHNVMRTVVKKQRRLPLDLAVKIGRDAADALSYAHTKHDESGKPLSIIHRDVSPQNLMVTYEGVVKLLDFGIAKAATRTTATEVGQLKGKLSYMPPEQARGDDLDTRADQFALGVTLFELITHTRLYRAMKEMDLFREVAMGTEPLPTPRSRDASIPEDLDAIVTKMMSRDREARYASMAEVRDALTEWLHGHSSSLSGSEAMTAFMTSTFPPEEREKDAPLPVLATPVGADTPMGASGPAEDVALDEPAGGRRRRLLYAASAAAGLVLVVLGAWALFREEPPVEPAPPPVAEVMDAGAATVTPPVPPVAMAEEDAGAAAEDADASEDDLAELVDLSPPDGKNPKPVKKRPAARQGKLSLQTIPWTIVYFGKKSLGETPLANVALPAGKHRLRLVNEEKKLSTTIEVVIKPGETTTMRLKL